MVKQSLMLKTLSGHLIDRIKKIPLELPKGFFINVLCVSSVRDHLVRERVHDLILLW